MMESYKRRKFFINKEFQGKYIFKAFIAVAVGSVLFALIFSFFSSNTLSIVYEDYHLKLGATPSLLLNKMIGAQWLFIVLAGIGVAFLTLFLTHRVAGPFFRFETTLNRMSEKNLADRIFLRKHDEGKLLAEKINSFNAMLSRDIIDLTQSAQLVRQCCESLLLEVSGTEINEDSLKNKLEKIRHHNQHILTKLFEYKIQIDG